MAYSIWQRFITDGGEQVVTAALISVYLESSGAPATIYDGPSGSPIGSTTTSDIAGKATFYAPAGVYKIVASKGTFSAEFRHVQLGNAQSRDVGPNPENLVTQEDLAEFTDTSAQIDATVDGTVVIAAATTALDFTGALSATKTIDCTDLIEAFPVPVYSTNGITAVTLSGTGLTFTGDLTKMAAGQVALLFRNGAAVHGNRLHIPPIESDITIAVPADYATLAEALDFVKSRVFLNGAKARIDVSAGTYTDQVVVDGIDLSHVSIFGPAVGAGTAVLDQTAWSYVGPWPGTRAYIQTANGGSLGPISGEWEGSILGYGSFVAANRSDIYLGAPDTAVDVTRFNSIVLLREAEAHVYSFTGSGTNYIFDGGVAYSATFGLGGAVSAPQLFNPSTSSIDASINGGTFTGGLTVGGDVKSSGTTYVGNIVVTGALDFQVAADFTGSILACGTVTGNIATITEPAGGFSDFFATVGAGAIDLSVSNIAPRASSTANYVNCGNAGSIAISVAGGFGNVSAGKLAVVTGAGTVRLHGGSAADFTGGLDVAPAATLQRSGTPAGIHTPIAITSASGVITIDCLAVDEHRTITLSENVTSWSFANRPASGSIRKIFVRVQQDAATARTVVSPASASSTAGGTWKQSPTLASVEMLEMHVGNTTVELFPSGVYQ